jgi:hypothetical protein
MEKGDIDISFLQEVENFVYMEDDLVDTITQWAKSHCSSFEDKDPRNSEQPLQHHEIYQEFCDLFEDYISKFLVEKNVSIAEFYKMLRREKENAESGIGGLPVSATFGHMLMSLTDFFCFCEMMNDVYNGNDVIFCPPLIDLDDEDTLADSKRDDYRFQNDYKYCK